MQKSAPTCVVYRLMGILFFTRVLDDGVEILRVINARRDLPSIFEDQK